jgi:acetylornithine deacetylase
LNGHVDVVPTGHQPWSASPFEPRIEAGYIHARGAADMRAGIVSALHATAAVVAAHGAPPGDVVVQSVVAEEDGGLGTFAALQRDAAFAGCVIAEPTNDAIVCANAGALTFRMTVVGRAAHASNRLDGVSALDRFLPVYQALQSLELALNTDITLPLMRDLALPYPLSVGVVRAGDWASTVPDQLVCAGRVGVPLGMTSSEVRRRFEAVVAEAANDRGEAPRIEWSGGQFEAADTPTDDRVVVQLAGEVAAETGTAPLLVGAPYGSDLRHFRSHGIPAVLYGPGELAEAHATDERVEIASVLTHARVLAGLAANFGKPAFT